MAKTKQHERKILTLERKLLREKEKKARQALRLKERVKKAKQKSVPISKLKKKLDKVFSIWIRTRDGGVCFTCGVKKPISEMQCGHFCSRRFQATRWDEKNCHCQCVSCNVYQKGQIDIYAFKLTEKYGEGIIEELVKASRALRKYTREEIEDMIKKYQ